MTADTDARLLNWRFLVPCEPIGLLLIPAGGETVPAAVTASTDGADLEQLLRSRDFPAIAVADLTQPRPGRGATPGRLLSDASRVVSPDGWLMAAFMNRWFPHPRGQRGLSLAAATRVLRRAGMSHIEVYLPLPDHRHPALLAPAARRTELDHVLRNLFLTYVPGDNGHAGLRRHVLSLARAVALRAPHRIRVRFAPAYCLVARRSP